MRPDGKNVPSYAPQSVVFPAPFSFPGKFDGSILIGGFGCTFKSPKHMDQGVSKFNVYAPTAAPERLLRGDYGLPSDIWSLACLIFELVSGKDLFLDQSKTEQMVLLENMEVMGKPSEEWQARWKESAASLDIHRRDIECCNEGPQRFDEMIDELDDQTTDKELLRDLLKRMLSWEPEERLSIKEVQEHVWLKSL